MHCTTAGHEVSKLLFGAKLHVSFKPSPCRPKALQVTSVSDHKSSLASSLSQLRLDHLRKRPSETLAIIKNMFPVVRMRL